MVQLLKAHATDAAPAEYARIGASAIPLKTPRLADTRLADKSSVVSPVVVRGFVQLADFLIVTLLGLAIAQAYVNEVGVLHTPRYLITAPLIGMATVITFHLLDLYALRVFSSFVKKMPGIVLGWSITFVMLVAAIFFLKMGAEVSRVWLATWYVAGAVALVAERIVVAYLMRKWAKSGRLYQRAVIYGSGAVTEDLIQHLEADHEFYRPHRRHIR